MVEYVVVSSEMCLDLWIAWDTISAAFNTRSVDNNNKHYVNYSYGLTIPLLLT